MSVKTRQDSAVEARLQALNQNWLALAREGKLGEAWRVSDEALSLRAPLDCSSWPRHHQFIWRGDPVVGKRVFVRCYHGLGDTIQFARFLPELRKLAREVVLWAQPSLLPILGTLRGAPDRLLPLHDGVPDVDYDVDVELAELMHVLRVTLESVGTGTPYLLTEQPAETPARVRPRLRVGLVWRSGEWNGSRSIPCDLMRPLRNVPDVEWVLMQRGPGLADWHNDFGHAPDMCGILDEARELRSLDLLISVDTCSAHLAGALGVPVWTLLPFDADWRWMSDREDTPWYPTMRLFRQPRPGDWHQVIANVLAELTSRSGRSNVSEALA